jgi:hypothetical protein
MNDKWEDKGESGGVADQIISTVTGGGGERGGLVGDSRNVVNTETGEERVVDRGYGQTTGEAIEKGQFRDKK